jgi:sugar lactone lactonase YvrE
MQLRCKPDFQMTDTLGKIVQSQFIGYLVEVFFPLKNLVGKAEAAEVFVQTCIGRFEYDFIEPFRRVGGQVDSLFLGDIDEGPFPKASVKVNMKIGFGQFLYKLFRILCHSLIITVMAPYTLQRILRFIRRSRFLLYCLVPLLVSGQSVDLQLRVFPAEADLFLLSSPGEADSGGDGPGRLLTVDEELEENWRIFRNLPDSAILELRAPGFETRRIHLSAPDPQSDAKPITMEERLAPSSGPLRLVAEGPTGGSPKSVVFLDSHTVAVPLLRGPGIDIFRIEADRWGNESIVPAGRWTPPEQWAREEGFVESLVVAHRDELWVSQMTTARVHRFRISTGEWLGVHPSGGRWPKVMVWSERRDTVWVANWYDRSVSELDRQDGRILRTVPVDGQPRGLLLDDDGRLLWVCIFSSGEVLRIDTESGEVVDRFGPSLGAARHIIRDTRSDRVFYSDMYYGTVSAVDPATARPVASRRVGSNINTIVSDPRGEFLFVSERGRNNPDSYLLPGAEFGRIFVLDPVTLETVQELHGRHQPTGLAISPEGTHLVATDFLDDNVTLYRIRR